MFRFTVCDFTCEGHLFFVVLLTFRIGCTQIQRPLSFKKTGIHFLWLMLVDHCQAFAFILCLHFRCLCHHSLRFQQLARCGSSVSSFRVKKLMTILFYCSVNWQFLHLRFTWHFYSGLIPSYYRLTLQNRYCLEINWNYFIDWHLAQNLTIYLATTLWWIKCQSRLRLCYQPAHLKKPHQNQHKTKELKNHNQSKI